MHPILFELGGRSLYGYWFFYGLGMLLGSLLCILLGRRRSLPFWRLWTICVAAVVGAFCIARVSYLFFDPGFAVSSDLTTGGEISFGGLFGAAFVFMAAAALLRLTLRDVLDTCAPSIFLAQGIQRLGCFCNGCCHGPVYDSFFSVRFPKIVNLEGEIIGSPCFAHHLATGIIDRDNLFSLPVIPMQFVSMAVALTVAGVGVWLYLAGYFRGRLLWFSFAAYGPLRFSTQWFRPNYDGDHAVAGWNIGHTMSVGMFIIGIGLFLLTRQTCMRNEGGTRYRRRLADESRSEASKARLSKIVERKVRRSHG